jgi:hypothetical protein
MMCGDVCVLLVGICGDLWGFVLMCVDVCVLRLVICGDLWGFVGLG